MLHRHKITILLILLSFSSFASAGVLGYIDTGRVNSQVIMAGVTPSIIDAGDTEFDILALVRPGFFPLQNVTIGQGKGAFNSSLTHINTLANGDQIWKKTLGFERSAFGKADLIITWGSGDGQYFIRATDTNQQSFDANTFPLMKIENAPNQIVNVDTSKDSNLIYNSTKRNLPQIIMAGVSPAIVDIVDTSFDLLTIIRPGALPIKSVILKQGGNNLFSYSMDKRTDLSNGDQLWGTNFAFPQGSFGIQTIPIVWGRSLNEFTIEVIDSAQQKAPGYPLLRSGNYPLVTSATTCNLPQLRNPATNTCYTPNVTCTAPQLRNAQTNTCFTPDVICTAPQVRNAQNNTCYTPHIVCTLPQIRNAQTNSCYTPDVICTAPQVRNAQTNTCYTQACPSEQVRDTSNNVCYTSVTNPSVIDSLYSNGVGNFLFGSSPDIINKQLAHPFGNVAWNSLPIAGEITTTEVRYFWKPLSDFTGLPYQNLYQNCLNDGSYIVFLFTKNGLSDVSIRFYNGCDVTYSIMTSIAKIYNLTINNLSNNDIGFNYSSNNVIFASKTNKANSMSSIDWVAKSNEIHSWSSP